MATKPKKSTNHFVRVEPDQAIDLSSVLQGIRSQPGQAPADPVEEPGMFRSLADSGLALGSGVVTGAKMVTDAFGADNSASQFLGDTVQGMQSLYSPHRQAELARRAQIIKAAEESGSTMEEIAAYLGGLAEAPVDTLLNAAGTMVPTAASMLIPGAREANVARLLGAGMGAVQGAGAGKSSIYDATLERALAEGRSPDEAKALAAEAQSYGGENTDLIAANAGLGVLAGSSGVERALHALKFGRQGAASAPGLLRRTGTGALAEGVPEGFQGGVEQLSGNVALQRQGYEDVPTMRGVLGSGAMEAVAGGGLGAVTAIPRPADPAAPPIVPPGGPLSRAANAGAAVAPPAPEPVALAPEQEQALLAHANQRAREIEEKANGTKEQKVTGLDGKPVTIPGKQPEFLTPAEKEDREFLQANGGDAQALLQRYGMPPAAPASASGAAEAPVPASSFASLDEADEYLTQQRVNGGGSLPFIAVPVQEADGTITLISQGDQRFKAARQARVERIKARKEAATAAAKTTEPSNDLAGEAAQPGPADAGAVPGIERMGGEPADLGAMRGPDAPIAAGDVRNGGDAAGAGRGPGNDALSPTDQTAILPVDPPATVAGFKVGEQVETPDGVGVVEAFPNGRVRVNVNGKSKPYPRNAITKPEQEAGDAGVGASPQEAPGSEAGAPAGVDAAGPAGPGPVQGAGPAAVEANGLTAQAEAWDRANRNSRADEWFDGANVNGEARAGFADALAAGGADVRAHGMAKVGNLGKGIKDLMALLQNGLDPSRGDGRLHYAPLVTPKGAATAGTTPGGSAYSDGPFMLLARPGQEFTGRLEGVGAILVNQAHAEIVPALREAIQAIRPDMIVESYSEAGTVVRQLNNRKDQPAQDQGAPVAPAGPGSSRATPAPEAEDAPEAAWTRATEADRYGILARAGWAATGDKPSTSAQRAARMPWAKLSESQRARIGGALGPAAPASQADPTNPAASIYGADIDGDWQQFGEASGTRGVPRADMPQIKAEHRGAMTQFLAARGITHEQAEVPAGNLKPTQAEFSREKVKKAKAYEGGDRSILVSSDGHVLDGHHQWLAKHEAGEPVKVIRLDAPIERLLTEVREFPSAEQAEGAAPDAPQPAAEAETPAQPEPEAPALATESEAPAQLEKAAAKKPARESKTAREAREAEERRASYFTPGNIVAGYGGHDRILSYTPPTEPGGAWSVKVQAVVRKGDDWAVDQNDPRTRSHQTQPSAADFKRGPVGAWPIEEPAAATEPAPAPPADEPVQASRPAPGKIEDFGEKLEGARKDYATLLKEAAGVDVSAEPLSKSWPEPDYQKLLAAGTDPEVVSFVRALRDQVATKPKKEWKLSGWVADVQKLRGIAQAALTAGKVRDGTFDGASSSDGFHLTPLGRDAIGRAALYQAVGHEQSLKGVTLTSHSYSIYKGVSYQPAKTFWLVEQEAKATTFSNWPRELASAETRAEAIEQFTARMKGGKTDLGSKAKKQPQFVLFTKRGQPGVWIGKKIGREHVGLKRLDDLKAARTYLADNLPELERLLEKYRETPLERKAENQPRVGDDHRNGAPVTPEVFAETFGFRGVQFGNYVEQSRRQSDLNEAFDGLMDMAAVLGVPPRALSLNGRLGLAFGARGKGGKGAPAAHFEPGNVVINLTKGGGPGSLAHEWWHAADSYFAKQGGDTGHATGTAKLDKLREQMQRAFAAVKRAVLAGAMEKRSQTLDGRRTAPYWSTPHELSARSFESYIIAKLADQGAANDYLANVVSPKAWDALEALRGRDDGPTYPYPLSDELPAVRAAFDELFQTIETRGDDDGNVAMFSRRSSGRGVTRRDAEAAVDLLRRELPSAPEIVLLDRVQDAPAALQATIRARGAENDVEAVYEGGVIYAFPGNFIDMDRFMFVVGRHEVRHAGFDAMLGQDKDAILMSIGRANRRVALEARKLMDDGFADSFAEGVEEALADMTAEDVAALSRIKLAVAAIRRWLRATAFKLRKAGWRALADAIEPRTWSDNDVIAFVKRAEDVSRGPGARGAARFSRSDEPNKQEARALAELSKHDDLFALKKSFSVLPQQIAKDIESGMVVQKVTPDPGKAEQYKITTPNGEVAWMYVRTPNPFGSTLYGFDMNEGEMVNVYEGRPGENPDDVDPDTQDVYIDASKLTGRGDGQFVYALAGAFAHNTGRIFIGDPAGLSDDALRRRPENMVSLALKYGTTKFLAPHPRQIVGAPSLGVPPLKWVYGDDVGNLHRLIALNAAAVENAFPDVRKIEFDLETGTFRNATTGQRVSMGLLRGRLHGRSDEVAGGAAGAAKAGSRTYARAVLWRALSKLADEASSGGGSRDGRPAGVLDGLRDASRLHAKGELKGLFSRASRQRPLETLRDAALRGKEATRDLGLIAGYKVGDFLESAGKLSWWDKSVGTPYNLAKRSPTFARVYDAAQAFLSDVSYHAKEAANLAPGLLPELDTIADLKKKPISAADNKALAAPIFEGTLSWVRDADGKPVRVADAEAAAAQLSLDQKAHKLLQSGKLAPGLLKGWQGSMEADAYEKAVNTRYANAFLTPGVVWTDAELRKQFGLADGQIGLYKEFRAATDKSVDDLTQSELARMVRVDLGQVAPEPGQSVDDFAVALRDRLYEAGADDTADRVIQVADRLKSLKERGYAPLSRFGHYTLDVVQDGERVWFGLYESQAEANKAARKMADAFPGAEITQGTQSQEAYKLFAGITPETIELFGDILGLDADGDSASDKAFQEYLKRATASRSAMKRMIHRKGIAGFSEDVGRVLAGFITSNARRASAQDHMGEIGEAAEAIPKEQGELKDYALKFAEYVKNPTEEAQAIRGVMFTQYLGGSISSALVNMTQPFTVAFPYLSQFGGVAKAGAALTKAMADMRPGGKLEADLAAALHRAEEDGKVAPQEIHQLMAQARGVGALRSGDGTKAGDTAATVQNHYARLQLVWGKLFSFAELTNRRMTYIAAYRMAKANGEADPDAFARKAIDETMFVMNKGNRPQWARGAIGATLFTFKSYMVSYLELMARMYRQGGPEGKRAFWIGLAVLLVMGGGDELPFMENIEDLVDGFAQNVLGQNWQTKAKRHEFMADLLGKDFAAFLNRGVSSIGPVDVTGRFGMGSPIPGTGLFRRDTQDTGRDWAQILGPVGDLVPRMFRAGGMALRGDVGQAALEASPVAARNAAKGMDMWESGMYKDTKGRKVIETDAGDALWKGIGFQPAEVGQVQSASVTEQRMIALNKSVETEIADLWAKGRFEKDPAKVEEARTKLREWNEQNPDSRITIGQGQIIKKVKKMNETKAERLAKTAPKEIRESVRRELKEASQ